MLTGKRKGLLRLVALTGCISLWLGMLGGVAAENEEGSSVKEETSGYTLLDSDVDVKSVGGAAADGTTDDTASINTAVNAGKEAGKRLFFGKGTYFIKGAITFPSAVSLVFEEGAVLKLDKSAYLSVNSVIKAGNYQIFEGDGTLKINSTISGNPFWFGAKGDGVTDDTDAFVKGYKVFNELSLPYTEEGYVITSLTAFTNMSLTSAGSQKAIIKASAETSRLIYAPTGNFKVTNLIFNMADAGEKSAVFYFDTAVSYIEKVFINHCVFNDAYYVFTDAKDKNVMMHMHFEDIECYDSRNSTYFIEDFEGFIFLKRFKIDNSNSFTKHGLKEGFPAIQIDDVRGTIFEDMEVVGANSGYEDETGFLIPSKVGFMASVWWDNVTVKNMSR